MSSEAIYFFKKTHGNCSPTAVVSLSNFHLHANVGSQNRKGTKQGQPIDDVPKGLRMRLKVSERNKQVSKQVFHNLVAQ